jgi:HD superfamily phosphohydrolase
VDWPRLTFTQKELLMTLHLVRRIRDNLHGSIDVTELEDLVIAHPFFQRMRRVRQLAFLHYVFPGATHTRFEHSLGVLHLAGVAWEKIKANQARLRNSLSRYPDFPASELKGGVPLTHGRLHPTFALMDKIFNSDYILQTFRLAALLHDVGHPAFSHSGEHFMPSWKEVATENPEMPDYIRVSIEDKIRELEAKGIDPATQRVRHEIYSILLIERILSQVYVQNQQLSLVIDPRDVISIINPSIEPSPESPLIKDQAQHLLRELISGELDIDRMDYLLRDSRECGVVYGVFDVDRILDSLCLYFDDTDRQLHVAILLSGLAAFEDYLRARYSMYLQLYFHKSSVAAEAMMWHLTEKLHSWRLPARLDQYAAIDEYNIGAALWEAARSLNPAEQAAVHVLVADLLYNRNLWKRVYEISGAKGQLNTSTSQAAKAILQAHGITHQEISSGNNLTRFQPRRGSDRSHNYLRLIRKDEEQWPRVCPIEDYSSLIASNDSVTIIRIYATPTGGHSIPEIKNLITTRLRQAPSP